MAAENWPPPGVDWYYVEDNIAIACADCRDILPLFPKVDLVITDQPYGVGKASWDSEYVTGWEPEPKQEQEVLL